MISIIKTVSLLGIEANLVEVQTDISGGLPNFEIIGLPDVSVRESKGRIKAAIKNSQIQFPSRKVVVNLAPASTKKIGTSYDLPIAVGILASLKIIDHKKLENTVFLGELSLDGKLNTINGVLPMCLEAFKLGINRVFIPKNNEKEARIVKNLEVIGVENLGEVIEYVNGSKKILAHAESENIKISNKIDYDIDYADVNGQENVKRALEIAAAGGHNCLLIGPPGAGKTMMAKRIVTILPDMSMEETLEVTKIHSIYGILNSNEGIVVKRPFRSPYNRITMTSMLGGGRIPKPGEISLAHNGVLFLDELPEFNKNVLEQLRQPLEEKNIQISRLYSKVNYPCNFMLIASMNPCPCGYYGSDVKECKCSKSEIDKYIKKISGPFLDRIDLHVEIKNIKYEKIEKKNNEKSEEIKKRVNEARNMQFIRYKNEKIYSNSQMTLQMLEKYCVLDQDCKKIIKLAFEKYGLSMRAYSRILKVARTIADLDKSENIKTNYLAEAIQYRCLDEKYGEKYD